VLRRFLYLNSNAVDSYLGVIESGLSDSSTRRRLDKGVKAGKASVGLSGVSAGISRDRESSEEDERTVRETPEQRFDRLMAALAEDPDRYTFEDVLDLQDAFERCVVGSMISVACDIEIPQVVRIFAQPEQLNDMLNLIETMRPLAGMFGKDGGDLPSVSQTNAIRSLSSTFKSDLIFVGDTDEGSPRVAGKLEKAHLVELPEGEATVVGKVARRWKTGESHPLLALPGASIMPRKQRREGAPSLNSDDDSILRGPDLTLDVVAIYR
jgi:hypothetical protein